MILITCLIAGSFFICTTGCTGNRQKTTPECEKSLNRAVSTLDSLYKYYGIEGSALLRETYPFDVAHEATYLASDTPPGTPNQYSYLWPYSGVFSAVNALFEATGDEFYYNILSEKILPGLENYFDSQRLPPAYSSYINTASPSDRFYDDNIWLGIDFTDTYKLTRDERHLDKAKLIWKFIGSGTDDKLGGGIYWVEQKKDSKNSCSNAPGSVYALKLFEATADSSYFRQGIALYEWTKKHLQDTDDYLIYDNIKLSGIVDKKKYPYNSGQMMQAAALLYKHTGEQKYLTDAQNIAQSAYSYFFEDYQTSEGEKFMILKKNDMWFIAVMLRGFIELFHQDANSIYVDAFRKNLDYAWKNMRDVDGFFHTDWKGVDKDSKKWLLTQAAMVEIYGRLAALE